MSRVERAKAWLQDRRTLIRVLRDTQQALRNADRNSRDLAARLAELGARVHDLEQTTSCTGPGDHVRLAHRLEQAEAQRDEALGREAHRHSLGES